MVVRSDPHLTLGFGIGLDLAAVVVELWCSLHRDVEAEALLNSGGEMIIATAK
jgi:hypothetical protein